MKDALKIHGRSQIMAAACVLLAAVRPALAQPQFHNLGTLPGQSSSSASDISADGTVVVGTSGTRAFRWTASNGLEDLGILPGFSSVAAAAISSDSQAIVGTIRSLDPATQRAFRWTAIEGMQELGVPTGGLWSVGRGISGDGAVIVGQARATPQNPPLTSAFRWTADSGMVSLAPFATAGSAADVSDDGWTIVGLTTTLDPGNSGRAFRWQQETGLVTLQPWGSHESSSASAVSADGSIVIGMSASGAGQFTFSNSTLWDDEGTPSLLASRAPLGISAYPTAISGDGTLIGGYEPGGSSLWFPPLPERAILWPSPDVAVDVNQYLPTLGIDLTGWHLTRVTGISADGSSMVGWGEFNGQPRGWLVRGIPEPSTAALLAIGVLAFGRRR